MKGPRLKLVIDESKLVKVVDEKDVTRVDWIKMQKDREDKARELADKQLKMRKARIHNAEKGEIIVKKIEQRIRDHDISMQLLGI